MIRAAAAVLAAYALLASGCATQERIPTRTVHHHSATATDEAASEPARTPSAFRRFDSGDAWEIEHFDSLEQLVRRSDVVLVGTVTGGHWGHEYRDVEVDASGTDVDVTRGLVFELHVDDTIDGHSVGPKPGSVDVVMDVVEPPFKLDPPMGEQAVFFLRRVGAPIPGHDFEADPKLLTENIYRPVSSIGVLDLDRGQLAFPMGGGADWAANFLKLSWDQAIAKLKSLAPG